jgi:hypothetical protein
MRDVFQKTFQLVQLLARENAHVQFHLFERIDVLLDVRVVESDLALAMKEVFRRTFSTKNIFLFKAFNIVLLRDVFHIGLVIVPRPAVLA